ncbi:secreted RxLR effector protein 161-like [Malania oleifera]|uniref:secreted RxLR effector protein 161-like n=1 Tax=Malania oleifera TaxID=397392 RepID=UPI0025AEA684|nr:secreted RxLR effector protein 161-like [Malania oleifera]
MKASSSVRKSMPRICWKKFKMEGSKAVTTSLVPNQKLTKDDGAPNADERQYGSIIGSLLYLTATIPDIMFATSLLSRFMQTPSQVHLTAAKRLLSDWAGSVDDMKSTSGYTCLFNSGVFSWLSQKQDTVAQSTVEAEYIAACAAAN